MAMIKCNVCNGVGRRLKYVQQPKCKRCDGTGKVQPLNEKYDPMPLSMTASARKISIKGLR